MKINLKAAATVIIAGFYLCVYAQDKPAYRIFTGDGKVSSYTDMFNSSLKADVVFFGELHNNPVSHWLQLELAKDLFSRKGTDLVLGAEMFERDNQLLIDEYLKGIITESSFENEARLWPNYKTDYKPLMNFAREKGLIFIASNIPRRYASIAASGGFDPLKLLSPESLAYMAPLPVEYDDTLPCYRKIAQSLFHGALNLKYKNENIAKAQAIKDATMADSIAKFCKKGRLIMHINGSYHTDSSCGIIWYMNRYRPGLKIITVSTVLQDELSVLRDEHKGKADFIVAVPSTMTMTH